MAKVPTMNSATWNNLKPKKPKKHPITMKTMPKMYLYSSMNWIKPLAVKEAQA